MNKDSIIPVEKNNVLTPEAISEAFEALPSNYIVLTLKLLEKQFSNGLIERTYTKDYISKVKTGRDGAFNEDIMNALVEVGMKSKESKEKFGRITKKASPSN